MKRTYEVERPVGQPAVTFDQLVELVSRVQAEVGQVPEGKIKARIRMNGHVQKLTLELDDGSPA